MIESNLTLETHGKNKYLALLTTNNPRHPNTYSRSVFEVCVANKSKEYKNHRENAGTLGMVPPILPNPINTPY